MLFKYAKYLVTMQCIFLNNHVFSGGLNESDWSEGPDSGFAYKANCRVMLPMIKHYNQYNQTCIEARRHLFNICRRMSCMSVCCTLNSTLYGEQSNGFTWCLIWDWCGLSQQNKCRNCSVKFTFTSFGRHFYPLLTNINALKSLSMNTF